MTATRAVCVPGTLCDARLFAPLLGRLDLKATVAGFGDADDVAAAADALLAAAPPHFVAIGFSLGGFVVLELLRRAPERLIAAVLIASNAHPDAPGNAPERERQVALFRDRGAQALIDELWPRYVAPAARDRDDIRDALVAMAGSFDADAFAAQARLAMSRPDSRGDPRRDVPTLVICGGDDATCPPDRCAAAAEATAAQLVTLPGVGHFVPLEAPDAAAAAIAAFLQDAATAPCC